MALCKIVAGGGGSGWSKEDLLWTNPSPTAIFDHDNCTMAHSIDDYDYLQVKCKLLSNNTEYYQTIPSASIGVTLCGITGGVLGSTGVFRSVTKVNGSSTLIEINRAYPINSSASSGVNNVFTPLEVVGLKM